MLWRLILGYRSRAAYRRCLANIDRLERELFPEWFPAKTIIDHKRAITGMLLYGGADPADFDMHPGARWLVDSPNCVQIQTSPYVAAAAAVYAQKYAMLEAL